MIDLGKQVPAFNRRYHQVELGKVEAIRGGKGVEIVIGSARVGRVIDWYAAHTVVDGHIHSGTGIGIG